MKFIIAAMALATSSLALAYHCPNEMKAIDAKLATNPTLSAADMGKVRELRAEGEKLHKAGKHDESLKALDSAKKLLGI
ncbi:MAG: hypothetical protein Q8R06_01960 [Polaromonas sp.]|uniref:hypothetical protein n=1 Tax=Polaromonas sp. TaxID=1869339 RepID=UPI0027335C6C|nr:hypothetical protein [Polaromonas sp.]MDP3795901.1 hypothetical protein [Polaromonas sp.]